jgi:hypothetical protein
VAGPRRVLLTWRAPKVGRALGARWRQQQDTRVGGQLSLVCTLPTYGCTLIGWRVLLHGGACWRLWRFRRRKGVGGGQQMA